MAWLVRVIMAVGRMALGFIGVSLVAVAFIAPPRPAAPARTGSIPPAGRTGTVTLRVPEGELAGHLTVVDESGRPLAVLTRWRNGSWSIAASRVGDVDLGCFFNSGGTALCRLFVASRRTTVSIDQEGVVTTAKRDVPPSGPAPGSEADLPDPPRPARSDGLTETARRVTGAACDDPSHPGPPG